MDPEILLKDKIESFVNDPYGFVMYAYPWGEKDTLLENETGPDKWQERLLKDLSHALQHGWVDNNDSRVDIINGRIWIACKSGHGIGKSTLMAWIDHWFLSTHPHPQSVTTANTETQLRTKTWRESAKWYNLLINKHWFNWTATRLICLAAPETWYSQAVPWSGQNTQSFAGTHERFLMMKYDEASEIDDQIWEVTEGAMTEADGIKIWIVFGNPTQATGRFIECFKKFRDLWITYEIDARDSKRTDKALIEQQILAYGEDSDFVRVRIKGQEPRAGMTQFLPTELVERAKGRHINPNLYIGMPRILGIDIARFGDDRTVFVRRQGLASYGLKKYRNQDSVQVAGLIAEEINTWEPDAVFLDMGSIGAAIYDILTKWNHKVTGVWFSSPAEDQVYLNKRMEMVGRIRDWLTDGGCIPDDNEMRDDMIGPQYFFNTREQLQLEAAKDMKARGLSSPDCLMALALTFAYPVAPKAKKSTKRSDRAVTNYPLFGEREEDKSITNYDLFGYDAPKDYRQRSV